MLQHRHSVSVFGAGRAPRRRAFTLLELMVAVAILGILIVIFSGILTQVTRIMNLSNDAIRIDRAVGALDKLIRRDMSSISKGGFLKITDGTHIAFAAVGSFDSMVSAGESSNAAIIDYGLTTAADDAAVAPAGDNLPTKDVIWRRLRLLIPGQPTQDDHIDAVLPDVGQMGYEPPFYSGGNRVPPEIKVPPSQAADWCSYVSGNCSSFKVFWWDGLAWSAEGATGSWTAADPNNWPQAVRIQFDFEGRVIEIVVKIE